MMGTHQSIHSVWQVALNWQMIQEKLLLIYDFPYYVKGHVDTSNQVRFVCCEKGGSSLSKQAATQNEHYFSFLEIRRFIRFPTRARIDILLGKQIHHRTSSFKFRTNRRDGLRVLFFHITRGRNVTETKTAQSLLALILIRIRFGRFKRKICMSLLCSFINLLLGRTSLK